jgi:hypothetical protein
VRDPALRKTMGMRGRALVVEHFSVGKVTDATLSLYRQLL